MSLSNQVEPAEVLAAFPELNLQLPPLGHGASKSAYRTGDSIQRVLKLIREPLPSDAHGVAGPPFQRLMREIAAMQRINHPRIVPILAGPQIRVINNRQYLWYIEPLFSGGTLEERLTMLWPEEQCLELLDGLVDGAEVLATSGIVHRDIKPSNIAFDNSDQPVLIDLGIAYFQDLTSLTDSYRASPRTELYAAPEQFIARRYASIDSRTDMYLIGIVFFQALTGVHPFIDSDLEVYRDRLTSGQWDAAALQNVSNNPGTAKLIRRLLDPAMSRRYNTYSDLRTAIEECR